MARRIHPEEVDAVIRSSVEAGMSGAAIHRQLSGDDSPLGRPLRIGKRTVQEKAARYRDERRRKRDPLQPLDDVDAGVALMRSYRQTATLELERIEAKTRSGKAIETDHRKAREIIKNIAEVDRFFRARSDKSPRTQQQAAAEAGNRKRSVARSLSTLERLAKEANGQP